jgi:hypothetical protein
MKESVFNNLFKKFFSSSINIIKLVKFIKIKKKPRLTKIKKELNLILHLILQKN